MSWNEKLARFMRMGEHKARQTTKSFIKEVDGEIYACAMGMAMYGFNPNIRPDINALVPLKKEIGIKRISSSPSERSSGFPSVTNPVTGQRENAYNVIVDLNNDEGWAVPEIAAWLETLSYE